MRRIRGDVIRFSAKTAAATAQVQLTSNACVFIFICLQFRCCQASEYNSQRCFAMVVVACSPLIQSIHFNLLTPLIAAYNPNPNPFPFQPIILGKQIERVWQIRQAAKSSADCIFRPIVARLTKLASANIFRPQRSSIWPQVPTIALAVIKEKRVNQLKTAACFV